MQFSIDSSLFYEGVFDSAYKFPGVSVTEERTVDKYELELSTQLGGRAYVNGESHAIRPGLLIFAKPGDTRHTELPLRCHYIKIDPALTDICAILDTLPSLSCIRSTEQCAKLVREMVNAGIAGDMLTRTARLLEFISIVSVESRQYTQLHTVRQKRNRVAVEEALRYMETHFGDKISLDEIAALVHFSPYYFHRLFRAAIGKTPNEYLTFLRISEAKRLLLEDERDMVNIAALCGFPSQSYFNYIFKKETGMAPNLFKKQYLAKYSF